MMKEYITRTLYEEPKLVIGTNEKSVIFGQNDSWLIMDKGQLVRIEKHFATGTLPLELEDIHCKQVKDKIQLSQSGSLLSISKKLLTHNLLQ